MWPGRAIKSYRILARLGHGGMGVVWKAESIDTREPCVLKCLPAAGLGPAEALEFRQRLQREARILTSLDHENIVRAREWFEDEGELFLVLELVPGATFDEWLRASPPLADRLGILDQVAAAMEYAHGRGVIHRDLKPANILVTPVGVAKVLDFGLARAIDSTHLTRTNMVMGTIAYMAPEQGRGQPVDERADIFSLGMILAKALGATEPFVALPPAEAYVRLLSPRPVAIDSWIPADVAGILERLLEKDQARRVPTASEARNLIQELKAMPGLDRRLDEARSTSSAVRRGGEIPKVEHPELRQAIDDLLSRAGTGRGRCLLVLGPPGMGKSRSLAEAADALRVAGARVQEHAFTTDDKPLEIPWRYLASQTPVSCEEETVSLPRTASDATGLVEDFLKVLRADAKEFQVALVIDDIHQAAPEDLQWLDRACRICDDSPLVLVLGGDIAEEAAARPSPARYGAFLRRATASDTFDRLTLDPLDPSALREALSLVAIADGDKTRIIATSGGNPRTANQCLERFRAAKRLDPVWMEGSASELLGLSSRWQLLDAQAKSIVRCLVEAGGLLDVQDLVARLGAPRLHVVPRVKDLERKHGWVRMQDSQLRLVQPLLGAIVRMPEPSS